MKRIRLSGLAPGLSAAVATILLLWFLPQAGNAALWVVAGLIALGALRPSVRSTVWRVALGGLYGACLALVLHLSLLNQAPESAYFAQTLATWEQGRFIRFHGLAQWLGWLWPFATIAYALAALARRPVREVRS